MDYDHLTQLRRYHPTWRLLANDQAPFVVAFRAFITPNVRTIGEPTLASHLDDYVYHLRGLLGEDLFPRPSLLSRWSSLRMRIVAFSSKKFALQSNGLPNLG